MHFHLYRISASLVSSSLIPHAIPLMEYNTDLTYESPSTIPILTSTVYTIPSKSFLVKCRREGDARDVDLKDLAFEVFLDGVWIGGCTLKAEDPRPHSRSRAIVPTPNNSHLASPLTLDQRTSRRWIAKSDITPSIPSLMNSFPHCSSTIYIHFV